MRLKFRPEIVLLSCNAFEKTKHFMTPGRSQSLHFWSNFGPIYPPQNWKTKYYQGKRLSIRLAKYPKIKAVSSLNFELKIWLLFVLFGGFFWEKMGAKVKDQEVRGQVSSIFLEAPNWGLTASERTFVIADCNLVLIQL